jgi:peroxiredoxin
MKINGTDKITFLTWEENIMPRVSLNQNAPNFSLTDFSGNMVSLSDYQGKKNVLLVFNRTFA